MKKFFALFALCFVSAPLLAQDPGAWLSGLAQPKDYVQHRASSYDRSGANADFRTIAPGETLTVLDDAGPGMISHVWFTIASDDPNHLKALVLRMYWDGETSPSVETPVGDFFGLGLGQYYLYQSLPLSVGGDKALNSFFPMPFQKHARITITNEGSLKVDAFYFNIDYRAYRKPLAADSLYFHAQYRQAAPAHGLDQSVALERRSDGRWQEESEWRRQLCLDGGYWSWALRGRDHVGAAESGWLVGRGRRHVFRRRGEHALNQRNRVGRLFSGSMGFWGTRILLWIVRRAGGGAGSGGWAMVAVSLSSRFADSVYEIAARDYRAWARQSPIG